MTPALLPSYAPDSSLSKLPTFQCSPEIYPASARRAETELRLVQESISALADLCLSLTMPLPNPLLP